jgi:hypothetical protein
MEAHKFHPGEGQFVPPDLTPEEPHAPPMHWGTFLKSWPLRETVSVARSTLVAGSFQILREPSVDAPVAIGQVPTGLVVIACAPVDDTTTWVMVAATSTISGTAEQLRNAVREEISKLV